MEQLHLTLHNFRRFTEAQFQFDRATILIGPNGVGKTSLIEALVYASVGRSYRTSLDRELVTWDAETLRVKVELKSILIDRRLSLTAGRPIKQHRLNEVPRPFVETLGALRAVLFAPELIELVTGPPRGRRRYLDTLLASLDLTYATDLLHYQHSLAQRNALLGSRTDLGSSSFEPWEVALAQYGTKILVKRQAAVSFLAELVSTAYADLVQAARAVGLTYLATIENVERWTELLAAKREIDRQSRATTLGPHRDDLEFSFDGRPAAAVTSRGEQRTLLLALKSAELSFLETKTDGAEPILLLDDMFSELDTARSRALASLIGTHRVVITATDAAMISPAIRERATVVEMAAAYV